MCLEDGLKIEGEAVPQCEFAAGRTCKNSSAFRRPLVVLESWIS